MSENNGNEKFSILRQTPISSWDWPRVLLYVPMERTIAYASQFIKWYTDIVIQAPDILKLGYMQTAVARNRAGDALLEGDWTHIIMLDMDHYHQADIIQQLSKWFINDPELRVVGGLNFKRGEPYIPCAFIEDGDGQYSYPVEWESGLIKVDALGTGCIMIAREVFEELEAPYFYYPNPLLPDGTVNYLSEDWGFAFKCKEAGIDQWVDTTLTSPHYTESTVDERTFRSYMERELEQGELREREDGNYERLH